MSDFKREDRYIVIKRSDMEKLPTDTRRNFQGRCRCFYEQMLIAGAPARSFLVIESDWPEYELAWQMIERRVNGQPAVTGAEELDAVRHWRSKHAQAIKERDALQQRLTAADERSDAFDRLYTASLDERDVLQQRAGVLERDKVRIDWLAEQPVDTLYLDDGRIIDIAGRIDLRDAIDAAMAAPAPSDDDCRPDHADANEPPCSACFSRGCNGECMENL